MKFSTYLKKLYKITVPYLPGYNKFCLFIRKFYSTERDWISRLPVKPGIIVPVLLPIGNFNMCRPERCSIAKKFFWTSGRREPAEDRIALDLFVKFAMESEIILDIGSNSGLFALAAAKAKPTAEILAFDILLEANKIFINNIKLNNFEGIIDARLTGIGVEGVFKSPSNEISSEMPTALSVEDSVTSSEYVNVPIITLDQLCIPKYIGKKTCIKIDVESTEVDIFNNGLETLKKIKPVIICEVLMRAKNFEIYDKILTDFSYRKFLITAEGLKEHDSIIPDKKYKDWFFIADDNFNPKMIKLDQII
ncbi:FkbM family methyltransferase [Maridesulfovibrio bastinii]|uniref:FkbM family methyltransferase n=1 Tax=Maridesulfovibrio bastinii TaxID=47157 RepID=UPI00040D0805|nr:FkbM family methyltransferase [Maridesulfovibrio bastinii]